VILNVYDRLISFDRDYTLGPYDAGDPSMGTFVPSLATEWTVTDDPTYKFKIRSGVEFHPWQDKYGVWHYDTLTTEDVEYSFKRLLKPTVVIDPGHGGHDLRMSALAMNMGGHARAGFEDSPYYGPGELAKSNAQLIERLVRLASEVGRNIATPTEARRMLGLKI